MQIKILTTFENVKRYLEAAERNDADLEALWEQYMIEPFWADIARWAPFEQSFKKPAPIYHLKALKEQITLLSGISTESLQNEFQKITQALPINDESMLVALFPHSDDDKSLKERENGVRGTSVFGNIIISINPLHEKFAEWLPYVFAHEYHHNVWGYHKYVLQEGKNIDGSFLEYMLTEGQADAFAQSLFPQLSPLWNRPFDPAGEKGLWEKVRSVLFSCDRQTHEKYMFGNENEGLPWCVGYSFGRAIVADYMQKHPDISFLELTDIASEEFLKEYHLEA